MEHPVTEEGTPLDATMPRLPIGGELPPTLHRVPVVVKDPAHMNDDTQRLIDQSIRGTQWIMIAIVIGVPLGLVTQILIQRLISNAAFGRYSFVVVLVTAIQTFFLFGGANVVVNFIPRASAREKSGFLFSYICLALVFCAVFLGLALAFPGVLQFLLLEQKPQPSAIYLLLILIPAVICQTLTIAVLQGEMELPAAARTQYGVQTMSFVLTLLVAFVVIPHHLFSTSIAVAGIVLGAYVLSFLTGFITLWRVMRQRWQFSLRWYLPKGFWRFTTTFHINTIAFFFFTNVDQIFIFYYFQANADQQNGVFRAAVLVATYALWAPNLFTGAMYPFFTNLVARQDFATLKSAYQRYTALTGVIVGFFGLASGLFAPQILHLFNKEDAALPLMVVFAGMYTVLASSAYVPTTALITAHEDVWLNLIMNVVAFAMRIGLFIVLVGRDGLLGLAIADAISLAVLHIGSLLVAGLRYHVSVPLRQHVVSLTGAVMLAVFYLWQPHGALVRVGEATVMLLIFVVIVSQLRLVSRADMARVTSRLGSLRFLRRFLPA